jgi:hypothetical protein
MPVMQLIPYHRSRLHHGPLRIERIPRNYNEKENQNLTVSYLCIQLNETD